MGQPEPPYLYDAPSRRPVSLPYSSFEPKRVTKDAYDRASQASRPQSTRSGPLLDFNRHPDSYLVLTGSELKHKPMPSNTKKTVASMRWIQFVLRVFTLLGAMGALFCAICLKVGDQTQAWIMRIAPAYDILITVYAVYHLIRSSKARTPGSSASYHFFALMMDVGIIPFYAFVAVFSNSNLAIRVNNVDQTDAMWTSFFTTTTATIAIIETAYYTALALASLHFISLGFDLYLIIIFRKISNLPPDMNPLEDNLTSRRASKHKYKNSELSLSSTVEDKGLGYYSGSTLGNGMNDSRLSMPDKKEPEVRQIAFGHSRAGPSLSFSPHNPESARLSRQQYDQMYQQASARNSTLSVGQPQSFMSATSRLDTSSPINNKRSSAQKHLTSDNWYVLDDEPADIGIPSISTRQPKLPDVTVTDEDISFVHRPLAMNPPTPNPEKQQTRDTLGELSINRSGTVASDATITSSVYSESAPSMQSSKIRTPKSKYYGDLAAAARGVRGYAQLPQSEQQSHSTSPGTTRSPSPGKKARVISRSGADIADENTMFIPEKSSRRRMVSGKAAEEGFAGYGY